MDPICTFCRQEIESKLILRLKGTKKNFCNPDHYRQWATQQQAKKKDKSTP